MFKTVPGALALMLLLAGAAAAQEIPAKPTATACYEIVSGVCHVTGQFTLMTSAAGADHFKVCRSNDTTGWGGCEVVMATNAGASYPVSGVNLPSVGYRRAYRFSACDASHQCTTWSEALYVQMDEPLPPPPAQPTATCDEVVNGHCYVGQNFVVTTSAPGAHHLQLCRSIDTTGWGGCNVVISTNSGTSFTVTGDHRPSDGYVRAYRFSACNASGQCTAWTASPPVYVHRNTLIVPTCSSYNPADLAVPSLAALPVDDYLIREHSPVMPGELFGVEVPVENRGDCRTPTNGFDVAISDTYANEPLGTAHSSVQLGPNESTSVTVSGLMISPDPPDDGQTVLDYEVTPAGYPDSNGTNSYGWFTLGLWAGPHLVVADYEVLDCTVWGAHGDRTHRYYWVLVENAGVGPYCNDPENVPPIEFYPSLYALDSYGNEAGTLDWLDFTRVPSLAPGESAWVRIAWFTEGFASFLDPGPGGYRMELLWVGLGGPNTYVNAGCGNREVYDTWDFPDAIAPTDHTFSWYTQADCRTHPEDP